MKNTQQYLNSFLQLISDNLSGMGLVCTDIQPNHPIEGYKLTNLSNWDQTEKAIVFVDKGTPITNVPAKTIFVVGLSDYMELITSLPSAEAAALGSTPWFDLTAKHRIITC